MVTYISLPSSPSPVTFSYYPEENLYKIIDLEIGEIYVEATSPQTCIEAFPPHLSL